MSAAARGAAGALSVASCYRSHTPERAEAYWDRMKAMQVDMDRIASGQLPKEPNFNRVRSDARRVHGSDSGKRDWQR